MLIQTSIFGDTTAMKYAIKNLELIEEKDAVISVTQRELFSSFGVYESIKVIDGKMEYIEDHLDRLFESARILKLEHSFKADSVITSLKRLLEINKDKKASLKLQLIGGEKPYFFCIYYRITRLSPGILYKLGIAFQKLIKLIWSCNSFRAIPVRTIDGIIIVRTFYIWAQINNNLCYQ